MASESVTESKDRKKGRKKKRAGAPEPAADTPADEQGEALGKRLAALEEELERVQREAAEASDRALRTLAEFDNYRKRVIRDREEAGTAGAARVLGQLLSLADDFDRALEHAGDDVPEGFLSGMRLVARRLHEVLDGHGVSRIEAVGEPFDPELHEALSTVPSGEAAPNTVLQEAQSGYLLGDRVLRPAKVIVSRSPEGDDAA